MIQKIDAALYKSMVLSGAALLEQNKQQINDLNVFPVPDGDTGTNMSLTMNSGVAALSSDTSSTVGAASEKVAGALLRGARGNSGVILSLLFRGMAKSLRDKDEMTAADFALAMRDGVAAAYKAVMRPTEGTILTVSRLSADAASDFSAGSGDIDAMFEALLAAGDEALAATTEQNPVLKKAGVVDAGGKGYLFLMRGMLAALRGTPAEAGAAGQETKAKAEFSDFKDEDIAHTYCTEFIVSRQNVKSPEALMDFLNGIGDSIVVVDDDDIIKVHVHTDEPGSVLTQALTYGSLVTVKIENMRLQHTEMADGTDKKQDSAAEPDASCESASAAEEKPYGVVAVCAGGGMEEVFRNLGVDALVTGGQTMNPSTEDILKGIQAVPAKTVFILPNNKNIIMAAQQCDDLTDKRIVVIPSKTVPQGISAMVSFDASLSESELTEALTDACKTVHTVQVTYAARDSEFDGLHICAGEYLALLEGTLIGNGADLPALIGRVAEKLEAFSPDIITVYFGADVDEAAANGVASELSAGCPGADTVVVRGGQPVYYYMISAE